MEKENLPLYVHGMGRRRLGIPKENLTEVQKQETINEWQCPCNYEKMEKEDRGQIFNYQI